MTFARLHLTPSVGLAIVAVIVGLAGGAYAATRQSSNTITACVHHSGGGLYIARRCAHNDSSRRWAITGPRGQPGPQGRQGPQGRLGIPGSARGFAFVNSDGTVVTKGGSTAIAVHKIGTGAYCLHMTPSPGNFAPIVATLQGEDFTAGLISVNTSFGSACNFDGGIGVFTMNATGKATDHQFVVAVM